jgi:preprotein translocase subunit YajC
MFTGVAYAADAAPAAAGAPNALGSFVPLILIGIVFYFLLIRPQQKTAKLHQQFLASLKRGIRVATTGGVIGTIVDISDLVITLEVADGVKIDVTRSSIAGQVDKKGEPVGTKKDDKKKIG